MFLRKTIVLVVLCCGVLACGATGAMAQQSFMQKIELTPFVGIKDGGKINVRGNTSQPAVDNLLIKSGIEYGGIFDYTIWDNFQAEVMWIRQPSVLSSHDTSTSPATVARLTTTKLDTYTFGAAYSFRSPEAKLKPFIGGGIGFTNFTNTNNPNTVDVGFSNRLTYNIGGGAKYYLGSHVGVRVDVRYLSIRTTPSTAVQCGFFGCFQVATSNRASQLSAALGLALRF